MSCYFDNYEHLLFERKEHGILLMTINRPEVYNATNARLHWELSRVWNDISEDPETGLLSSPVLARLSVRVVTWPWLKASTRKPQNSLPP